MKISNLLNKKNWNIWTNEFLISFSEDQYKKLLSNLENISTPSDLWDKILSKSSIKDERTLQNLKNSWFTWIQKQADPISASTFKKTFPELKDDELEEILTSNLTFENSLQSLKAIKTIFDNPENSTISSSYLEITMWSIIWKIESESKNPENISIFKEQVDKEFEEQNKIAMKSKENDFVKQKSAAVEKDILLVETEIRRLETTLDVLKNDVKDLLTIPTKSIIEEKLKLYNNYSSTYKYYCEMDTKKGVTSKSYAWFVLGFPCIKNELCTIKYLDNLYEKNELFLNGRAKNFTKEQEVIHKLQSDTY